MSIVAFCPECHALWRWLFAVPLTQCRCPACRHRLVPPGLARPAWRGHEIPVYAVGSFDVCPAKQHEQARRSGVRPRAAWRWPGP